MLGKNIFYIVLIWVSVLQINSAYAGKIGSSYGPNKLEFLELCENVEKEIQDNDGLQSACFIYFMGIRDGYLMSAHESLHRAALYYWYKGNIPPGGELDFEYVLKVSDATDNPAYRALDNHSVMCLRKQDPKILLNNFIQYLKTIKRKNGVTKHFNKFVISRYAGKC